MTYELDLELESESTVDYLEESANAYRSRSLQTSIKNKFDWPDPSTIDGITEHQRCELSKAMTGNIGLFSGGPGCGKTHTVARLIKSTLNKHPNAQIRMMAPTGKAAQRMSEMASEIGLSNRGTTIHTGLVPQRNGHDGGGWGFAHNENSPLYADLVIADECPMIDGGLMRHLLCAIKEGTKVLLVGDPGQLAPVGKGRPYADMIEAGLPNGHLTELHRFAGRIARVCKQICNGEHWTPSPKIDLDAADFPENMRHVECNQSNQIEQLKTLVSRVRERGFDPWNDLQILCATNDLRTKLNAVLQNMLNPNGEQIEGNPFRMGDKVICLRNQWVEQDWIDRRKPIGNPQHYIANGEIGIVVRIDKTFIVIECGGNHLRFAKPSWHDVSLAYGITVWKAQGSQWPVVITAAEDTRGADMICDRSFWNTAISRGGRMSITLGRRAAIDRQCARAGLIARRTLLVSKIKSWFQPESFDLNELAIESSASEEWSDFSDV